MITIDPPSTSSIPSEIPLSKTALTRFLNRARKLVDLPGEVEVLLTSDAELKRLNRTFRGKNKPTDILSFPTPPEISQHHSGDLAISVETASRQAAQFGHTLSDELRILVLHGLLHLSGLDHETDRGEMAAREADLRKALRLPTALIARVTTKPAARKSHTSKSRHSDPDPERREGEGDESPHLHLDRPANRSGLAKKRANGPSHTSLGQRPRSIAPTERKRAEGPTHKSRPKTRAHP